ncbi:DUF3971 domain-containing protein [Roseococcus sp. DSY-14]|uniref:DUF3971 domain-containing protein n=1 Tax=Roseococcus sp. DSY-14 TaxID=3369650 RepID=UPI00387A8FE9
MRRLRWVLAPLLALPLLAAAVLGWLAWRLADGPLDAPWLARAIERQANQEDGPGTLSIRAARLSWAGFRGAAPLEVSLSGATLRDAAGRAIGALPEATVALALRPLLRGTLAATEVTLLRPEVFLRRAPDGAISLDLPDTQAGPAAPAAVPDATPALLADLLRPADERASHTALRRIRVTDGLVAVRDEALGRDWRLEGVTLAILRAEQGGLSGDGEAVLRTAGATVPVHLSGEARAEPQRLAVRLDLPVLLPAEIARIWPEAAALEALDAPLAIEVAAELDPSATPRGVALRLSAPRGGRLAGLPFDGLEARLTARPDRLDLESARIAQAGRALGASGTLHRQGPGWRGVVTLEAAALEAADLSRHWPEDAFPATRRAALALWPTGRLEALSLALDLAADADLRDWRLEGAEARGTAAAAVLDLGERGRLPARRMELDLAVSREAATLRRLSLVLEPPEPGAPAPGVVLTGTARLAGGEWQGRAEARLDRVRAADLPALWPPGLGGGERAWITQNVTAGEVREGRWAVEARAGTDLAVVTPTRLEGEALLENATIHWLRPVPPVRGVSGRARFSLEEITLATRGGRQEREGGEAGGLELREGTLRFLLPANATPTAEIALAVSGPVTEAVALIRHPRLHIFDRRPFPVQVAAGAHDAALTIGFPLIADLRTEQVRFRADARIRNARLARVLLDRDIENLDAELGVDMDGLRAQGSAVFQGSPVRLGVEMDFRPGPATQVVSRESASGRFDARTLAALGFDAGALLAGPVAIEARTERRRNATSTIQLRGDLLQSTLSFPPLRWQKPRGSPGMAEAQLRLAGDNLLAIEAIRIEALDLALRGRAVAARGGRIERVEFAESLFGASRFSGDARAPARIGGPWAVNLRGPILDLRPVFAPGPGRPQEDTEGDAPALALDLRFDQVLTGPGREVHAIQARALSDRQGVLREATLRGRTARASGPFELVLAPRGEARTLRATAEDGGALLRALGLVSTIQGGRMTLAGTYPQTRPGAALQGQMEIEQFAVREAPALGKLLQAMTLYGLVDAVQGGSGLAFARAVVPFTLTPEAMHIADARAFSPSLGITARGRVLRERAVLDLEGTIVPAYFFNSLLGNLPLVGRLFSPEAGGGVFAATFRAQGEAEDAQISVNPLAALTPGFLRGLFGLAEGRAPR